MLRRFHSSSPSSSLIILPSYCSAVASGALPRSYHFSSSPSTNNNNTTRSQQTTHQQPPTSVFSSYSPMNKKKFAAFFSKTSHSEKKKNQQQQLEDSIDEEDPESKISSLKKMRSRYIVGDGNNTNSQQLFDDETETANDPNRKPFEFILDKIKNKNKTENDDNKNKNLIEKYSDFFTITSQTIADGEVLWLDVCGVDDLTLADWRSKAEAILTEDLAIHSKTHSSPLVHHSIVSEVVGRDALPQSLIVGNGNNSDFMDRSSNNTSGDSAAYCRMTMMKAKNLFRVGDGSCDSALAVVRVASYDPPLRFKEGSTTAASNNSIQKVSTRLNLIVVPCRNLILTIHRKPIELLESMLKKSTSEDNENENEGEGKHQAKGSNNNHNKKEDALSANNKAHHLLGEKVLRSEYESRFKSSSPAHLINTIFKRTYKTYFEEITRCVIRFDTLESKLFNSEIDTEYDTSSSPNQYGNSSNNHHRVETRGDRTELARKLYQLKRRTAVYSRALVMNDDVYQNIVGAIYPPRHQKLQYQQYQKLIKEKEKEEASNKNKKEIDEGKNISMKRKNDDPSLVAPPQHPLQPPQPTPAATDTVGTTDQQDPFVMDVVQYNQYCRSLSDNLSENVQNTVQLLFQLSSHSMNEMMKVLTLFSAFFIPLTFFVSIFGTAFEDVPWTKKEDFPKFLTSLMTLSIGLILWFRRKF